MNIAYNHVIVTSTAGSGVFLLLLLSSDGANERKPESCHRYVEGQARQFRRTDSVMLLGFLSKIKKMKFVISRLADARPSARAGPARAPDRAARRALRRGAEPLVCHSKLRAAGDIYSLEIFNKATRRRHP
ncbi:hypothetical protein EVAR_23846_1 [Eumeta japonica]|uniref:Uncharacterized protein n=1 Tax=Eumeta variegata TaxID=151549 RepID=A0A4C1V5Z7_EUMVA|nr:hypothetical protein EVAR_23846_1 [Eumeta japonica]